MRRIQYIVNKSINSKLVQLKKKRKEKFEQNTKLQKNNILQKKRNCFCGK